MVPHDQKQFHPQPVGRNMAIAIPRGGRNVFETHFSLSVCGIVLLWTFLRVFDFALIPPAYNGIAVTQPFYGLHSWAIANRAWAARSHVKYGLSYTKGLHTLVVGNPPPLIPEHYISHPPLEIWILALGMLVFGTQDWSVRLVELVFSVPCLLLILLVLRKLHGSACALLSSLLLVMLPYSAYFGFNPLMVVLGLWALCRYLLLTGRLDSGPAARPRHLAELAIALFLLVQFNWVGIFYAFTIGLHYVLTCWTQRRVEWRIVAAVAVPSLFSLSLNFGVMVWGMQHNINVESPSKDSTLFASTEHNTAWQLIATLYQWRARSGERSSFSWGDWEMQNLEYAQTNFTAPLLVFLGVYLLCLLIARLQALKSRLATPAPATTQASVAKVLYSFPHLWFYLLPGLFFVFTFKGLMWRHQYWQSPFALFVAVGSALALLSVGEVFGRIHRWFGRLVVVALVLIVAAFCNQGLASYRAVRWQSPRTLALFKLLNREIPPDKALLTFRDFMIRQSKAKAPFYQPVYAWYLDREMIVANAWKYDYYYDRAARIEDVVRETVREVQAQAETGSFWYYLIPAREEYLGDPLREEQQLSGLLSGTLFASLAPGNQPGASEGMWTMRRTGVASLGIEELDRRLHDNDPRDDTTLMWEKHRRYREAVIARLKELYDWEYYGNTARPGDGDFCYSGITPCYLFDLLHPKQRDLP